MKSADLADAGVERVPRVAGARDGLPMLEGDRVLPVANVVAPETVTQFTKMRCHARRGGVGAVRCPAIANVARAVSGARRALCGRLLRTRS